MILIRQVVFFLLFRVSWECAWLFRPRPRPPTTTTEITTTETNTTVTATETTPLVTTTETNTTVTATETTQLVTTTETVPIVTNTTEEAEALTTSSCKSSPEAYQESQCDSKGGVCKYDCNCTGETLNNKCPTQPGDVKCCIEVDIVESCNETIAQCVDRMAAMTACSSEPSESCKLENGYCGNPDNCPEGNFVNNKCPGGNDNKCCLSYPIQETECASQRGECKDECGCMGEVLSGLCPSQPNSIKCCKSTETTTSSGGMTTEEATETCIEEVNNSDDKRRRKKRSTGQMCPLTPTANNCSDKYHGTCSSSCNSPLFEKDVSEQGVCPSGEKCCVDDCTNIGGECKENDKCEGVQKSNLCSASNEKCCITCTSFGGLCVTDANCRQGIQVKSGKYWKDSNINSAAFCGSGEVCCMSQTATNENYYKPKGTDFSVFDGTEEKCKMISNSDLLTNRGEGGMYLQGFSVVKNPTIVTGLDFKAGKWADQELKDCVGDTIGDILDAYVHPSGTPTDDQVETAANQIVLNFQQARTVDCCMFFEYEKKIQENYKINGKNEEISSSCALPVIKDLYHYCGRGGVLFGNGDKCVGTVGSPDKKYLEDWKEDVNRTDCSLLVALNKLIGHHFVRTENGTGPGNALKSAGKTNRIRKVRDFLAGCLNETGYKTAEFDLLNKGVPTTNKCSDEYACCTNSNCAAGIDCPPHNQDLACSSVAYSYFGTVKTYSGECKNSQTCRGAALSGKCPSGGAGVLCCIDWNNLLGYEY